MFEVHSPWPLTHLQDLWIKRIHNSNRVFLNLFCSSYLHISPLILLASNSNVQELRTVSTYLQLPFMDDGKFHDHLAIIVFSPSSSLHEVWLVEEEDPERFNGNSIYLPVPNIIPLSTIWNKCSYKSSFHIIKSPSFFTFPFLYWVKLS